MTLYDTRRALSRALTAIYPPREADTIARMVMEAVTRHDLTWLLVHDTDEASDYVERHIADATRRLLAHEPVQYLLGEAQFCGLRLKVGPGVLIPRPETAMLVDIITDRHRQQPDLKVLDLCSGSGCIALALARALPFAKAQGVDISPVAVDMARANAEALRCQRSATFTVTDILTPDYSPAGAPYDIIVSNPPYIARHEQAQMRRNVLDYEPAEALFVPDADPALFYRAIAAIAARSLRPGGALYLEINPLYADITARAVAQAGLTAVELLPDAQGRTRFITALRP